jgi:hypothetical protein
MVTTFASGKPIISPKIRTNKILDTRQLAIFIHLGHWIAVAVFVFQNDAFY